MSSILSLQTLAKLFLAPVPLPCLRCQWPSQMAYAIDDTIGKVLTIDPNVVMLARAIQGEGTADWEDDSDEIGMWFGHAALNYWETDWWKHASIMIGAILGKGPVDLDLPEDAKRVDFADIVAYRYHGVDRVQEPEPWAIHMAIESLGRTEDLAMGARFALSGKDLRMPGDRWPVIHAGQRARKAVKSFAHQGATFHFFKDWPF